MHMHVHVYHKGTGKKDANNITSLIMKTLRLLNLLRANNLDRKLVYFDNEIFRLHTMLTKFRMFKVVNMPFLVAWHTKKACVRLFKFLKAKCWAMDSYMMKELLLKHLCIGQHHGAQNNCGQLNMFLGEWHRNLAGLILASHMFIMSTTKGMTGNKFKVNIQKTTYRYTHQSSLM